MAEQRHDRLRERAADNVLLIQRVFRAKPEIVSLLRTQYVQVLDRQDLLAFDLARPERSH